MDYPVVNTPEVKHARWATPWRKRKGGIMALKENGWTYIVQKSAKGRKFLMTAIDFDGRG
jgi:hypothetical protein